MRGLTLHAACLSLYLQQFVGCAHLPLKLKFYIWYKVETYTSVSSWQKITIADAINFVTWPISILQTRMQFCRRQQDLKKWRYQSTSFIKKIYLNTASRSQDIAWLVIIFFGKRLVCKLSLNMNTLPMLRGQVRK